MKNQDLTPQDERRMRFAEAGILFALILGIAIFLGVKMGGDNETVTEPVAVLAIEPAPEATVEPVVVEAPVVETIEPAPAPEPIVVTYAMAEQAYFAKEYEDAVDLFASYVAGHPDNGWGHYMLGLSAWKAGDPEAADIALARAVELNPTHVKSLVNHGRVLLELDRAAEAETRLAAALDLDPANADARRVMGRVLQAQARVDEAIAGYEETLRLDGDDVWALNNLGLLLIQQERFADALAPLAKAASLDTDLACVRNNLGVALERTGHYAAAAEAYAAAVEIDAAYAKAAASGERVAGLTEVPGTEPVDLAALAAAYGVEPASADVLAELTPVPEVQDDAPDSEWNR